MPNFFKREQEDETDNEWRDLDTLPKEVISKAELDRLQKEVSDELEKQIRRSFIRSTPNLILLS